MENVHTTLTENPEPVPWYDGKFYKSCLAAFAVLRWVIVAGVFAFGAYIYQRDVNAQQTVNLVDVKREQDQLRATFTEYKMDAERQFQTLRKEMLTRELYEVYRKGDSERLERIEKSLEIIAARP